MPDTLLLAAEYAGVFAFAISGALVAREKGMDVFGFVVLALMPAIAGGTIRDLVLGVPVFWVVQEASLYIALAAALLVFFADRFVFRTQFFLNWLDALGLSVFCVLGAAKALAVTGSPTIAVVLGVVTAVAGGILRDVIANKLPLVLHREIYATAAFLGALSYILLDALGVPFSVWLAILVAFVARAVGLLTGFELPRAQGGKDEP